MANMKSEKAKEFLVAPIPRDIQESRQRMNEIVDEAVFHIREEAFDAAEQWLRTQLLRWRDPKKELPEEGEWVMLKMPDNYLIRYAIALYSEGQWHMMGKQVQICSEFLGWRPIIE